MAIREKKIYVLDTPVLPDSQVRIYFDIEGDPFVGEAGLEYLLGVGWTEGGSFAYRYPNEQDGFVLKEPHLIVGECRSLPICCSISHALRTHRSPRVVT